MVSVAAFVLLSGAHARVEAVAPAPVTHVAGTTTREARTEHVSEERRRHRPTRIVRTTVTTHRRTTPSVHAYEPTVRPENACVPAKFVYRPPANIAPDTDPREPIQPIKTRINPTDGAEMVWVPAGWFTMGDNSGDSGEDAEPAHKVYLDGYWIYKNDVTVARYRAFCHATGRTMPDAPSWGWHDDHPVVNVTWDDANAYARWAHVSLPTEAQWEKAARGTDGRNYPWGDDWDASRCANSVGSALSSTRPVGSYPSGASPYGAQDMAGNVWDWCSDWYDANYYSSSPSSNPTGPASGQALSSWHPQMPPRVWRGGSWFDVAPRGFRSAFRNRDDYTDYFDFIGFRCSSRPD